MRVLTHRHFDTEFVRLSKKQQARTEERIRLFIQSPFHPTLRNHALLGKYQGYRSINIPGDLRVIYEPINEETVRFHHIGTHSELYS
jgi:addiction module RelE/StbE family toxin